MVLPAGPTGRVEVAGNPPAVDRHRLRVPPGGQLDHHHAVLRRYGLDGPKRRSALLPEARQQLHDLFRVAMPAGFDDQGTAVWQQASHQDPLRREGLLSESRPPGLECIDQLARLEAARCERAGAARVKRQCAGGEAASGISPPGISFLARLVGSGCGTAASSAFV